MRGIFGTAVAGLGTRIVGGEGQPELGIPKETDLCDDMGVSRSVIRELFRILGAKGLIRSRTSDCAQVRPRSERRLLDPDVMDWRIKAGDAPGAEAACAAFLPAALFGMQSLEHLACYGKRVFGLRAGIVIHDRAPALRPNDFGLALAAGWAARGQIAPGG